MCGNRKLRYSGFVRLWDVIAKERISGYLDLPNGFQYAYTVSLYTHDSGSRVIDDSTIGGRWKTRLSESLPGWYLIFLVPVALVCLIYAGGIPYRIVLNTHKSRGLRLCP